jgi:hypothetical protein
VRKIIARANAKFDTGQYPRGAAPAPAGLKPPCVLACWRLFPLNIQALIYQGGACGRSLSAQCIARSRGCRNIRPCAHAVAPLLDDPATRPSMFMGIGLEPSLGGFVSAPAGRSGFGTPATLA